MLRVWNLSLLCATFSLTILGHVPHPLGRARVGARVQRRRHRRLAPHVLRRSSWPSPSGSSAGGATASARRAASTRRSRARARSSPTTCCSPPSPSWCCSARCSRCWPRSSQDRPVTVGPPYFDRMTTPDRHRAAVPHGGRAGAAVAQGVGRGAVAAAAVAGVGRRAHARSSPSRSAPGAWRPIAHLRPRRVRRRRRAPPGGAGHPPPGLARVPRSHQRRDDRAPRRGGRRRGHRRLGQLRARGRGPLRAGARPAWSAATRSPTSTPDEVQERNRLATKVRGPDRRRQGLRAGAVAVPRLRSADRRRRR